MSPSQQAGCSSRSLAGDEGGVALHAPAVPATRLQGRQASRPPSALALTQDQLDVAHVGLVKLAGTAWPSWRDAAARHVRGPRGGSGCTTCETPAERVRCIVCPCSHSENAFTCICAAAMWAQGCTEAAADAPCRCWSKAAHMLSRRVARHGGHACTRLCQATGVASTRMIAGLVLPKTAGGLPPGADNRRSHGAAVQVASARCRLLYVGQSGGTAVSTRTGAKHAGSA